MNVELSINVEYSHRQISKGEAIVLKVRMPLGCVHSKDGDLLSFVFQVGSIVDEGGQYWLVLATHLTE